MARKKSKSTPLDKDWQDRIVGHDKVEPKTLSPNPRNWRTHSERQIRAMEGVLNEVGWVQNIVVNQRTGHLIDGHLRLQVALARNEEAIPVTYVDLSENEEAIVLATLDPLAGLAGADVDILDDLLGDINVEDIAVSSLLQDVAKDAGIVDLITEPTNLEGKSGDNKRDNEKDELQYKVEFEDDEQKAIFFDWIKALRKAYPQVGTISGRMCEFLLDRDFHKEIENSR